MAYSSLERGQHMTLQQVQALIAELYDLSAKGDWDGVAAHLTDDFHIVEADSLPYGGIYEGKNALRDLFTQVMGFWEDPALDLHDVTVSEGNAIGIVTMTATSRHDGSRVAMDIAERFILRGGKVAAIKPYYFDTNLVRRAAGME